MFKVTIQEPLGGTLNWTTVVRESYDKATNLDSVLKSKNITLLTKVHIVNAMVFPVVVYRCESWSIKKAEGQRIDVFNCGAGKDSLESPGQQGDQSSQS